MRIEKAEELLGLDQMYGYCHKTFDYQPVKEVVEVIKIKTYYAVKALDFENRKLYTILSKEIVDQFKLKGWL